VLGGAWLTGAEAGAMTPADEAFIPLMPTGITRLLWLWVLGEVWFTLLMAGAVVVLLWAWALSVVEEGSDYG
jgi:hypothetical protein